MRREATESRSFEEADRRDQAQQLAMPPDERLAIARSLRERFFGTDVPDVRETERLSMDVAAREHGPPAGEREA